LSSDVFTDEALQAIYNITSGIPRDVLKICQILWVAAQKDGVEEIPVEWVEPMIKETELDA
jgi:hypothetical protein